MRAGSQDDAGSRERDHLLERLHHLRTIVPVFAQELVSVRRQAAQLRVENRRLEQEVRRLQRDHLARAHPGSARDNGPVDELVVAR